MLEIDLGWWRSEQTGQQARLTWRPGQRGRGTLFLFHATSNEEDLTNGVSDRDARRFAAELPEGASIEHIRREAQRWWAF